MSKVLVTGANGYLGSVLVRKLIEQGDEVTVFVLVDANLKSLEGLKYNKFIGDVTDLESLKKATKGVEIVYHLAAIISLLKDDPIAENVNVNGPKNVVKACLENNIKKLVHVGSIHAFRESELGQETTESNELDPNNPRGIYDRSKAKGILAILDGVKEGLDAVIICPTGIVGPFDYEPSKFGKNMIETIKHPLSQYIEGEYNYTDVRDVADTIIAAAKKGKKGEIYLLGGHILKQEDFYKYLEEASGIQAPKQKVAYQLAITMLTLQSLFSKKAQEDLYGLKTLQSNPLVTNVKAKSELGFNPRPIKDSIIDQYKWFKTNNYL